MKCPKCRYDNPPETSYCGKCGTRLEEPGVGKAGLPDVTETAQTTDRELTTGTTFAGRYQVIEELGRGGMGRVYKVLDTKIGEKIALKLIRPEAGLDRKTLERFSNELKLARKIRHRNVCQMFDLGDDQGTRYITMEYVHGEDLKQLVRKVGRLSPAQAISIARQVCEGLEEAHKLGVIHRDLKPQNIMVDEDGNARIMDFGIARSLAGKSITGAGVMIGTPDYMSPEQVDGQETDRRSDIYSLGIILYEMMTGRLPFEGDTALSIAVKHKTEIPKNPQETNAEIPETLSRLILRCLEKLKENRYQTAEELKEDLRRIGKGLPTSEKIAPFKKPLTSKEITVKFTYRKLFVPAISLAVLIAAGLFFLFRKSGPRLDPKRVVVALFENKTGDSSLDNLGYMASNRITQGLSQTGVVSISTLQDPGLIQKAAKERKGDPVKLLAKETEAGKVVTGSYYLQGERLQFQAQIQEGNSGKILAPIEPVSGPLNEPIKLIESLRQRVMGALATVTDERIMGFLTPDHAPYVPTYEAYKEYIEATRAFLIYEYEKAIEHLKRSISLDPGYILPLLLLQTAYHNNGQLAEAEATSSRIREMSDILTPQERNWWEYIDTWVKGDLEGQYQFARQMFDLNPNTMSRYNLGLCAGRINRPGEAVRVLKLADPESPLMWFSFWNVYIDACFMSGQHKDALKVAREARKHNSDLVSALWLEMQAYIALGRTDKVKQLLEESRKLPPESGWNEGILTANAGHFLRFHGHRDEAVDMLDRAIRYLKNLPEKEASTRANRFWLADSLYEKEQWQEARILYEALRKENPDNIKPLGRLGLIAAKLSDREEAEKISELLRTHPWSYPRGYHTSYRARIAAVMGEKEEAVRLLREAVSQGYPYVDLYALIDFEPLRDYPAFVEFMKPKG